MRESGCDVPEYILAMKKHSKRDKKKLVREAPKRQTISTIPKFQKHRPRSTEKKQKITKASATTRNS